MMISKIIPVLIYFLLTFGNAISITVSSFRDRCMIISSNNQDQYFKVDLKFNPIDHHHKTDGYAIKLQNTQTQTQDFFQAQAGVFRKEFKLTENVVYNICFRIVLDSNVEVTTVMEYNAGIRHKEIFLAANLTIPDSLLKIDDLQRTYTSLNQIQSFTKDIISRASDKTKIDNFDFSLQEQKMHTLEMINLIQLGVIVIFGIYQFVRLKTILDTKLYK